MDENAIGTKLIEDKVIAELKSVEKVSPANKKQTQTYLRLTGNKLGYLLNFGDEVMKTGITRCVNGRPESGMFCSEKGDEDVLVIRTALYSNRFDQYWNHSYSC